MNDTLPVSSLLIPEIEANRFADVVRNDAGLVSNNENLAPDNKEFVPNKAASAPNNEALAQTLGVGPPQPVRALVLTGFGINCEEEMAAAYRLAGAEATIVHLNQVLHGAVSIHDFDILNFPGGFSFGDDLGSGVVLANKLRYRQTGAEGRTLLDDIKKFVAAGKFVLGICNGFQVLVKLGLLPNLGGGFEPEVTLTHNASGRYENRWVRLRVNPNAKTPFLTGLTTLEVPVRHGEGRLVLPDEATREALEAAGLNCLSYVDAAGDGTSQYPLNPNGAALNCAGLTDTTGQIFGLMPHPEAFLAAENHPDWGLRKRQGTLPAEGEGLALFRNIVRHLQPHPPAPSPVGEGEPDDSGLGQGVREGEPDDSGLGQGVGEVGTDDSGLGQGVGEVGTDDSGLGQGVREGEAGASDDLLLAEPRPYYERRQRREAGLVTSIVDNVYTAASGGKWDALKTYGRQMRREPTLAENELWQALRGQTLGVAFRRQHAIAGYIVDFVTLADHLIVEVDGGIHAEPDQADYDKGRTQALQELGYQVVRFTNEEVLEHLPHVLQRIRTHLEPAN